MKNVTLPELLAGKDGAGDGLLHQTVQLLGKAVEFRDLMMMYSCAIKEIETKFDILNTEFAARYRRNPISSVSTRLKSTASIAEKLKRKGLPFTLETVRGELHDVAGVRVICSYIDDIYTIADALTSQDDITLLKQKDYIKDPKENGYRSLHLIVQVPVFFSDGKVYLSVEVQIRTIAMNFWASLEHQLKYKKQISDQQAIVSELKACADTINATDERMLQLRKMIENEASAPTEKEIVFEKLSKLGIL